VVERGAQRVDVAARVDRVAGGLLGRHVAGRAEHGAGARLRVAVARGGRPAAGARRRLRLAHHLGQPPVDDHRLAVLADQHIGRLEVPVHHALAVGEAGRVGRGQEGRHQGEALAERAGLLDALEQRAAGHQAHHVVGQPRRPAPGVVERHDRRVLQAGGDLHLALEAAERGRVGVERLLDGHRPAEPLVARRHHPAHPAARDLLADPEALGRPPAAARGARQPRLLPGAGGGDLRRWPGRIALEPAGPHGSGRLQRRLRPRRPADDGRRRARPIGAHGPDQYSAGPRARTRRRPPGG
jgi:hypothetical protein